jgi:hypothetical protein
MDHLQTRMDCHRRIFASLGACAFALLAGCAGSVDTVGLVTVDPAKFTFYNCADLATRKRSVVARERELRDLMERAEAGPGGALVSVLAYRSEYVSVRGELKLLQKVAIEKKCKVTQWQSEKVIR